MERKLIVNENVCVRLETSAPRIDPYVLTAPTQADLPLKFQPIMTHPRTQHPGYLAVSVERKFPTVLSSSVPDQPRRGGRSRRNSSHYQINPATRQAINNI